MDIIGLEMITNVTVTMRVCFAPMTALWTVAIRTINSVFVAKYEDKMTFNDLLKKYNGRPYGKKNVFNFDVTDTAYGAVIEKFEFDQYDIQLTCMNNMQLEELLKKLMKNVHN